MAQITVSLSDELEQRARLMQEREGYASLSDLVREALRKKTEEQSRPNYWERVILVELMQISNKVVGNNENENAIEALRSGYVTEYPHFFSGINREEFDPQDASFVFDILDCYQDLQRTAHKLNDENLIKEVRFPGFDGNNEFEFMAFANYLVRGNRWAHIDGASENMNSHSSMLGMYRRMVEKWQQIKSSNPNPDGSRELFTREQVGEVLEAQIHPEHRK